MRQMKPDMRQMKPDMRQMKPDMRRMKLDMRQMKLDMRQMKLDMQQMKLDIRQMKPDMRRMKPDIRQMKLNMRQMKLNMRRMKPHPKGVSSPDHLWITACAGMTSKCFCSGAYCPNRYPVFVMTRKIQKKGRDESRPFLNHDEVVPAGCLYEPAVCIR